MQCATARYIILYDTVNRKRRLGDVGGDDDLRCMRRQCSVFFPRELLSSLLLSPLLLVVVVVVLLLLLAVLLFMMITARVRGGTDLGPRQTARAESRRKSQLQGTQEHRLLGEDAILFFTKVVKCPRRHRFGWKTYIWGDKPGLAKTLDMRDKG